MLILEFMATFFFVFLREKLTIPFQRLISIGSSEVSGLEAAEKKQRRQTQLHNSNFQESLIPPSSAKGCKPG